MTYVPGIRTGHCTRTGENDYIGPEEDQLVGSLRGSPETSSATAEDIETILHARRLRTKLVDSALFADPAWDMVLDLYRAHLAQQRICTTSLCFGSGAPVSTALRWLNALEERGLAERSHDPLDRRRYFISLTDKGVTAMAGYFNAVRHFLV